MFRKGAAQVQGKGPQDELPQFLAPRRKNTVDLQWSSFHKQAFLSSQISKGYAAGQNLCLSDLEGAFGMCAVPAAFLML